MIRTSCIFPRPHLPPDAELVPRHQRPRRHREDGPQRQHPRHVGRKLKPQHPGVAGWVHLVRGKMQMCGLRK